MLLGINHIGVAVKNLDEAMKVYVDVLGAKKEEVHRLPNQGMSVAMMAVGSSKIELLEPIGNEGVIAKFLESRGEGFHHVCLEVDDVDAAVKALIEKGMRVVDKEPRQGIEGRIIFLHPKSTSGMLVELVETPEQTARKSKAKT